MTTTSSILTIQVPNEMKLQLEQLSTATSRSKSFLAQEALRLYVDLQSWQIAQTVQAISEADAGDFASQDEVDAAIHKWVKRTD